jgi:hypothetical protein
MKDRSAILMVNAYPGLRDYPDEVERQEVSFVLKLVDLPEGYSYMGDEVFVPPLPGALEDVPAIDPNAWKEWNLDDRNVTIPLPPRWIYAAGYRPDGGINLLDENTSAIMATVYCPIPATGFEAWKFDVSEEA